MNHYKTKGMIEGYIPEKPLIDGYTMFFMIDNRVTLQLNISGSAVSSQDCGVSRDDVFEWLWDEGNEMFLRETIPEKINITVTSMDVRNGNIIKPFINLRRDDNSHL
jgi:hypothetical protein